MRHDLEAVGPDTQAGRTHDYIVPARHSAGYVERRPFDLRVLVQKNSKGQWDITGVGARVAGSSSITTHVPRGGSIEDPEKLLSAISVPNKRGERWPGLKTRPSSSPADRTWLRAYTWRDVDGFGRRYERQHLVLRSQCEANENR